MKKIYIPIVLLLILLSASSLEVQAQNIGIGTPSPSEKLDVAGNAIVQRLLIKANSVSTTSDISFTANAHIETDNSMTFSIDANNTGSAEYFGFGTNSAARNGSFVELMRIEEGGNVGIGTNNPSFKLDVSGTGRFTGQLSIPLLPTADAHAASKKYVDDRTAAGEHWDKTGNDVYNNNTGNIGINTNNPTEQLTVEGQIVRVRSDGRVISALAPYVPMPSIKKASEASGFAVVGANDYDPNLAGESDPCSGLVNYAAAVAFAESQGARLPTLEEVESEVVTGTGCGYDSEYIWTQTKCGPNSYFVTPGRPSYLSSMSRECRVATAQAYTRMVAEVSKGNLPAIVDGSGALRTDKIKARVGDGIELTDDADNLAVFVKDGGNVGIGGIANPSQKLEIAGNAYLSSATGMLMLKGANGNIFELRPGQNNLNGIAIRATTNPVNEGSIFTVESSGSATRFGVTQGNGAFARDGFYVGVFDNGDLIQASAAAYMNISGNGYLSNSLGIGTTAVGSYALYVNGRIKSNGINETSDRRYKKNIEPLEEAMATVRKLSGVQYEWRTEEFPEKQFKAGKDLGVIAQEVEKYLPEVVDTDAEGYKSVQYSHIVPLLIEALKEQDSKLAEKELEIERQAAMLETLNDRINNIENYLLDNTYHKEEITVCK